MLQERFPALRLPRKDDICYATQNRQNAVKTLAARADLVLVVGAPESSNSNRLVELARKQGVRAYLVQSAADINSAWLEGIGEVGVTAGASAPEILVQEAVTRLTALSNDPVEVHSLPLVDERVVFQIPAELRT